MRVVMRWCVIRWRLRDTFATRKGKKSTVSTNHAQEELKLIFSIAVTLDGTVIHKTGLITGGRSSHGNTRKWEEKEIQGV